MLHQDLASKNLNLTFAGKLAHGLLLAVIGPCLTVRDASSNSKCTSLQGVIKRNGRRQCSKRYQSARKCYLPV